jgi:curved DNA-binding protein CbpA
MLNYYNILEVEQGCDFKTLKKAYYRKVKECHPDLFNNSHAKTEEFKILVRAFDVLSDPEKREVYDRTCNQELPESTSIQMENSVMDSPADDILEELIAGNTIPDNTSLATLMLDIERTEVFITFREGKSLFFQKRFRTARQYFINAVAMSPSNILYRVYLARDLAVLRDFSQAKFHYRAAINIGERRIPPQKLTRIRKEFEIIKKKHRPFWNRLASLFMPQIEASSIPPDQAMIESTNRAIAKILEEENKAEAAKNQKKLSE